MTQSTRDKKIAALNARIAAEEKKNSPNLKAIDGWMNQIAELDMAGLVEGFDREAKQRK